MLIDNRTLTKLDQIRQRYARLRYETLAELPAALLETRDHLRKPPGPRDRRGWRDITPPAYWGDDGLTGWFRAKVRVPKNVAAKPLFIRAKLGGDALFFVDGAARGTFDRQHDVVLLTRRAQAGRTHDVAFEAYAGHSYPDVHADSEPIVVAKKSCQFGGIELLCERPAVRDFIFDLEVLLELVQALDSNSLRRARIAHELMRVFAIIDAQPTPETANSWQPQLAEARRIMRPLLEARNSPTTPWFGVIGHSHLDTAWLWTIDETRRKCARTFSSALTMMAQYPEMLFVQSSALHAEMVRQDYPELFRRMRRMAKAGRWEPTGGMWVEPDCNLTGGESFARQLLLGQLAFRDMFGTTCDTAWLPDTFGYSAALPQLFRSAGIEFFCTTKLAWNDTTRFPHDAFHWHGLDGSSVLAHLFDIQIHPSPKYLTTKWNDVQNKDVQDRRLLAYGWGDGGGGPTSEELEITRRTRDLEGCPRNEQMRVSEFMRRMRDELPDLPTWVGELYLELHRGTLTSIAPIKWLNRKVEFALRDAEILWTQAALRGVRYPQDDLRELWKTLLTNQFHDILPGSSIAEANDQAIEELRACLDRAYVMQKSAAARLGNKNNKQETGASPNRRIANTLSWQRTGEIELAGVPRGTCPADAKIVSQWIDGVDGRRRLAIEGLSIPPLGDSILELKRGRGRRVPSPFKHSKSRIDTPHWRLRFDCAGRITSLQHKLRRRELVRPGGHLNLFLLGQDVPQHWDNWDIDADQRSKMQPEHRLVEREVVADGPLQLRIRSRYEIGEQSSIVQDMILHATTPRIDFETQIDWHDKYKLLKVGFDFDIHTDFARHEIQFGHVRRPTHANRPQDRAQFETCAHKWTDLSEPEFGVALLNDCKYGVATSGSSIQLSLIKSGRHPDHRGDEGTHRCTYALLPHEGFSVTSVIRPAYELNAPPPAFPAADNASPTESLLWLDANNVIVEAVKWAETGRALIVRLYEAGGTTTKTTLRLATQPKAVWETNLLEEPQRKLQLRRKSVRLELRAFEVKSVRIEN